MFKNDKTKITVFIAAFYILWLVRVFLIPKTTSEEMNLIISVALKLIVFVVFPLLYIKLCCKENPFETLKLSGNVGKGLLYGIIVSVGIGILGFLIYTLSKGSMHIKGFTLKDLFFAFVFAGFMEEVTFRGLILGKLSQLMSFRKASILTSLLFTFIHMPQSIANGTVFTQAVLSSLVIVFVWGIIDNLLVKKSNSLWAAIIPHGVWDSAVHILGF